MKIIKTVIYLLVVIIILNVSYAFQSNSSNFKLSTGTVSSGGDIVNSSNFKNYVVTGIVGGVVNSSTFKNSLGFFYTWLLADGQACTADNQCEGSFCCSNLCKNSACPTTTTTTTTTGGGAAEGGGGGGVIRIVKEEKDYSLSKSEIKLKLVLGETIQETFTIRNTGKIPLTISLDVEGINKFVTLSDNLIDLEVDEEIEVGLDFIGNTVGAFAGRIITVSGDIRKTIPVILEVITELVLFDVKLDIPAAYTEVEQGSELRTQITLLNVGTPEKVDVIATYFIKDLRGNIIYEETETFSVEKQTSYTKTFKINEFLEPESYVVVVEIRYVNSFAVSSQFFKVIEKRAFIDASILTKNTTLIIFLSFILLGIIAILAFRLLHISKKGRGKKK